MLQGGGEAVISRRLSMAGGKNFGAAAFRESAITIIDPEGVIVDSRGPLEEFFALGEGELAEKNWFELFVTEQEVAGLKADIEGLKANSAFSFISDYKATNKVFQWYGFVFMDADGKRRIAFTIEDVSDCKELGRQLEKYMVELERMTRAQSSRELRMDEMRRKIGELEKSLVHCKGMGRA
ncbi:hypothetical protein MNBD_DELTA01-1811 [hydrothermal vent metagenome]|uniref:PAC domain-containing protein n=1 Tax=hydrothermal vent metagenome TaxID=652676 RepID=A0A3B0R9L2_9ZZZZ